jgi:hypothetical protein
MASEKAIYWTAVIVMALAVANGFAKQYRGRVSDLVNCAVAWAEERSETAADYLNLRAPDLGNDDVSQVLRSRVKVVRVNRNVSSHITCPRVEMVRVWVESTRGRVMEHKLHHVINTPGGSFVIDVPQAPKVFGEDTL